MIEEKERLSLRNDMSQKAMAIRLRAARLVTGLSQNQLAAEAGIGKTALNNAEMGKNVPNAQVMRFLYRAHRIDFNFLMNGDFSQLPGDVQDCLFPALAVATSEWDRKEGSGPAPR